MATTSKCVRPGKRSAGAPLATRRGIPTEVLLDEDNGMPGPCALSLDNTVLMPKVFFVELQCRLGLPKMAEVCNALRVATGCAAV